MLDILRGMPRLSRWARVPSLLRLQDGAVMDICWSLTAEHDLYWSIVAHIPKASEGSSSRPQTEHELLLDFLVNYIHLRIFNGGAFLFLPALAAVSGLRRLPSPRAADLLLDLIVTSGVIVGTFNDVWGFARESNGRGADVFPLLRQLGLILGDTCWLHEESRLRLATTLTSLHELEDVDNSCILTFSSMLERYTYGMSAFGLGSPRYTQIEGAHVAHDMQGVVLSTPHLSVSVAPLDYNCPTLASERQAEQGERTSALHAALASGISRAKVTAAW